MTVIAEIIHGNSKACLYELPTYEEWFESHSYDWRYRNRTFKANPSIETMQTYQRAVARHLKQQGIMVRTFMRNCNGQRGTKIHQDS